MTLYEARYGVVNIIILQHDTNDFEVLAYKDQNTQVFSTKSFEDLDKAFYWFHKELLKTDMACAKCLKKINRQIARAREKQIKE